MHISTEFSYDHPVSLAPYFIMYEYSVYYCKDQLKAEFALEQARKAQSRNINIDLLFL